MRRSRSGRRRPRQVDFNEPPLGRRIEVGGAQDLITFKVETEREDDGRWLAEVVELPGVLATVRAKMSLAPGSRPWRSASSPNALTTVRPVLNS